MSILSQLINERFELHVAENIRNIKEKDYDDIFFLTVIKSQKPNFDNQKFQPVYMQQNTLST